MECMKFDRKCLIKIKDIIKLNMKDNNEDFEKMLVKCYWLFENGCTVVEDWVVPQLNFNEIIAVPWAWKKIPGDSGEYFDEDLLILIPKELAEKILVFGIPTPEVETSQMTDILKWWRGEKTLEQMKFFAKISE